MIGGLLGPEPSLCSVPSESGERTTGKRSIPRRPSEAVPSSHRRRGGYGSGLSERESGNNVVTFSNATPGPKREIWGGRSTRDRPTELNGPSYSLSGRGTYLLPATDEGGSSAEGNIDVWPANSLSGSTSGYSRAFAQRGKRQFSGRSEAPPKPKLLKKLERFIRDEFAALSLDRSRGPSKASLQVYREAFHMFITGFRAYKSVLLAIEHEYDLMIEKYSARLRCLPDLEARLATIQQHHAQELSKLKRWHRDEIESMQRKVAASTARAAKAEQLLHHARCPQQPKRTPEAEALIESMHEANAKLRRALHLTKVKSMEAEQECLRLQTTVETTDEYRALERKLKKVSQEASSSRSAARKSKAVHDAGMQKLKRTLEEKDATIERLCAERERLMESQSALIKSLEEATKRRRQDANAGEKGTATFLTASSD